MYRIVAGDRVWRPRAARKLPVPLRASTFLQGLAAAYLCLVAYEAWLVSSRL